MRFACIFVPHFVVQAALRCEPQRTSKIDQPLAILDGPDSLLRVFASNPAAERAGIDVGMTKAQAEQCAGVLLRKRNLAQEKSAQAALIDCASPFSPLIEASATDAVTFEIRGTERVFGGPEKLANRIRGAAALQGLIANVVLAGNADAALVCARGLNNITVIPSGEEPAKLAPLPIHVLSPSAEQAEILDSWGIRTCGDLAALPPVALVERLGQAGLHLQRLARGEVNRKLVTFDPPSHFEERMDLEESITDLESLAFLLNRLLNQIFARLSARGLASDEIRLSLDLEVHLDRNVRHETAKPIPSIFERRVKVPVPVENSKTFLKLLQLDLAAHSPGAAVKALTLEAIRAKPRRTQTGLFVPLSPEPEALEITLARLRAIVGEADEQGRLRVGRPVLCDSYKPDDFRVLPFEASSAEAKDDTSRCKTEVALSVYRPPLTARVRQKLNKPVHISFGSISQPILCAAGPWFTSGAWWHETDKWDREEWEIAIQSEAGLGVYRIFQEGQRWFVEGLYN